jgi:hypothetical protein
MLIIFCGLLAFASSSLPALRSLDAALAREIRRVHVHHMQMGLECNGTPELGETYGLRGSRCELSEFYRASRDDGLSNDACELLRQEVGD